MPGMGPAPKPADQRARRNATVAMTRLPADGRKGRAPAWPLAGDIELETQVFFAKQQLAELKDELEWATTAKARSAIRRKQDRTKKQIAELTATLKFVGATEKKIWAELWKTPQATQWEKRGWFREVALFARHQAKAESGSLDDAKEARQREDRLGLNDLSMLRLRWEIVDAAAASSGPRPKSKRNSSRYGNLRVVAS
jgi:hypothetical protein